MASPETFCDVFEALEREGVRYVVIGGNAVVLHGHVRPVGDLDVAVDPAPAEADRALRALVRAGFVPALPLPLSLLPMLRLFDREGREVNLFARAHVPFEELWAGSERRSVGAGTVRVTSLEHLLRAKRVNGRPYDFKDIEALLALGAGGRGEGKE